MYTLRQDLNLSESGKTKQGSRLWLLQDVINNRFYKMGSEEVKLLAYIRGREFDFQKIDGAVAQILEHFQKAWTAQRIKEFLLFLKQNNLLMGASLESRAALMQQREHLQPGPFKKLLRNYLFMRFHVLNPNTLLDKLLPLLNFVFAPMFWWLIGLNALIGVYLTARQWDYFLSSVVSYLNFQGVLIGAAAIAIAKVLHEFGHAIVARRFGCSVNSMGFALLIFWPVLFTDTTDSWRLRDPRQRALIGAAGVLVELVIASVCLTAWNFVDAGSIKSALFILATTTWILTLAVNLNPLMRFDGYFVLGDLLAVENLQGRSFALARWKLREWMFSFGFDAPEKPRLDLIIFAFATWVYRFLLYFAIALIIYNYFFKLLGIFLVAMQLFTSLVKPLAKEFRFWWDNRADASWFPNTLITFAVFAVFILWLVLPTQRNLSLPAYVHSAQSVVFFSQYPGRLTSIVSADGLAIKENDLLVQMEFPEIEYQLEQLYKDVELIDAQLAATGVRSNSLSPRASLVAQLRSAQEQISELSIRLDNQLISAPFDGTIRSINPQLASGQWLGAGEKLLTLISPDDHEIIAYLSEEFFNEIEVGQQGTFYSDGGQQAPVAVVLESKETFPVGDLDELYVASTFGGALSVRDSQTGNLTPQSSSYRLRFSSDHSQVDRILSGVIRIEAQAASPILRFVNSASAVWRREAGF